MYVRCSWTVLACIVMIGCSTSVLARRPLLQSPSNNTKLAQAFCNSPDIKKLQCGWATQQEQDKTTTDCLFCGTVHYGEPGPLPATLEVSSITYSVAERVVSLACKPGLLRIKSVFKVLPGHGGPFDDSCTRQMPEGSIGSVGHGFSKVRRCELALPAGTSSSQAAEASAAIGKTVKEVKCKEYVNCLDLKDMQKTGKWYSDTYTVMFDGCNAVGKKDYEPMMPGILINPASKFLLAEFSVSPA